jgi:Ca2+-binding EF-hand superfamily protein
VDQFAALDSNKDGRVNRSEFVAAFTAKHSAVKADLLFKLYAHHHMTLVYLHARFML